MDRISTPPPSGHGVEVVFFHLLPNTLPNGLRRATPFVAEAALRIGGHHLLARLRRVDAWSLSVDISPTGYDVQTGLPDRFPVSPDLEAETLRLLTERFNDADRASCDDIKGRASGFTALFLRGGPPVMPGGLGGWGALSPEISRMFAGLNRDREDRALRIGRYAEATAPTPRDTGTQFTLFAEKGNS